MTDRLVLRGEGWKLAAKTAAPSVVLGDMVLIHVDCKERRVLDAPYLPAVVMVISESGWFRCAADLDGMLVGTFHLGDQCMKPKADVRDVWGMRDIHSALFAISACESDLAAFCAKPKISVGVAERKKCRWNESRETGLCGCVGKCDTKSCSCFKNLLHCSSKCHKGLYL